MLFAFAVAFARFFAVPFSRARGRPCAKAMATAAQFSPETPAAEKASEAPDVQIEGGAVLGSVGIRIRLPVFGEHS